LSLLQIQLFVDLFVTSARAECSFEVLQTSNNEEPDGAMENPAERLVMGM
jgi:hypothetical protein